MKLKLFLIVGLLGVVVLPLIAQPAARQQPHSASADRRRDQFVGAVRAADLPEASSDVMLKAIQQGLFADARDKGLLAQEAFRIASTAPISVPRRPEGRTDTVETYSAVADAYRVSRVDLQARAVRVLSEVDPALALVLLNEIQIAVPAITCASTEVPDLTFYYETAERVFGRLPGGGAAESIEFLRRAITSSVSPAQFAPFVQIVAKASNEVQDELMPLLIPAFASAKWDARTFAAYQAPLLANTARLGQGLRKRNSGHLAGLVAAARSAVVRHLAGQQCKDARQPADVTSRVAPRDPRQGFHDLILPLSPDPAIGPIVDKEIASGRKNGGLIGTPFWELPQSKELLHRSAALLYSASAASRDGDEWKKSAKSLLEDIRQLDTPGDFAVLRFCEKAVLFKGLLEVRMDPTPLKTRSSDRRSAFQQQPEFSGKDQVLGEIIRLLSRHPGSKVKSIDRGAWLRTVQDLFDFYLHSRKTEIGMLGDAFIESGDPALYAYGVLARDIFLKHTREPKVQQSQ